MAKKEKKNEEVVDTTAAEQALETVSTAPVAPKKPKAAKKVKAVNAPEGGNGQPDPEIAADVAEETVEVMLPDGSKVVMPKSAVAKGQVVRHAQAPEGHVALVSADGRVLEASIGDQMWKGKEIYVPAELEGEVRRLLNDGHYIVR